MVGVNDQFTMAAWKEKLGADKAENVHFLADDTNSVSIRSSYLAKWSRSPGNVPPRGDSLFNNHIC